MAATPGLISALLPSPSLPCLPAPAWQGLGKGLPGARSGSGEVHAPGSLRLRDRGPRLEDAGAGSSALCCARASADGGGGAADGQPPEADPASGSASGSGDACDAAGGGSGGRTDAEWLSLLPEASSALYCCSLPGIEAWLRLLGFQQLPVRPEEWRIEKDTWQAELSLDVTELCVRYTTLDKSKAAAPGGRSTVERRFSYALSRQDLENAILAGP